MKRMNPYIGFNGNCREVLSFYQSVFGGDLNFMTVGDCPPEVREQCGPNHAAIMHGQLDISPTCAVMGTDMCMDPNGYPTSSQISVAIDCDSMTQLEAYFSALGEGGTVACPLGPAFWGGHFGMVDDKYGIGWMLTHSETSWTETKG